MIIHPLTLKRARRGNSQGENLRFDGDTYMKVKISDGQSEVEI